MKALVLLGALALSGCATTCDQHPIRCAIAMCGEAIMVGLVTAAVVHQRRGPPGPAGPPGPLPVDPCPTC